MSAYSWKTPFVLALFFPFNFFSTIYAQLPVQCNNWLKTVGGTSGATMGNLSITGNTITVEALINMTTATLGADVVSKHNSPSDANYLLRPTHVELTTTSGFFVTTPACDITNNKTYHIAFTYDGSRLKFYRNGYLMSSLPCTGNMITNSWPTTIGNLASVPGYTVDEPFIGYINEVRIWNVARTQAQIQTYMNASIPNPASQIGLLAYYAFDNTSNKQGNAMWNGTLMGGATINAANPICSIVVDSCSSICAGVADFNFQQNICNPLSVQFQNGATNVSSSVWNFGNGSGLSNTSTPSITYSGYGNYTVKLVVTTITGCKDSVTKSINVRAVPDSIIPMNDTTLCEGDSIILKAFPGLNYCWTSSAAALTNSNTQFPVAHPVITTTYYVNSLQQGTNLIANSNFSLGNTGFTTTYTYIPPPNTAEGQYYVGSSAIAWNALAYPCVDHTTGNGNMLMVNGASTPGTVAWSETVSTIPNTNYAFSAWIESIYPVDPAQLQFSINGKTIGNIFTASTTACSWQQVYITWNSGSNSTALISIVNQNLDPGGNDFALDDIFFGSFTIKQDSVKIKIVPRPVLSVSADTSICAGDTIHLSVSGADSYSWTGPNNTIQNPTANNPSIDPFATAIYTVGGYSNGCRVSQSVLVTVFKPDLTLLFKDSSICINRSVTLLARSVAAIKYQWTPAIGLSSSSVSNPTASPAISQTYTVKVTDIHTCTNRDSVTINVFTVPTVTVRPDTSSCKKDSVRLYNTTTNATQFQWQPAVGLSDVSAATPMAAPASSTSYTVIVTNPGGCTATGSVTLNVLPLPVVTMSGDTTICQGGAAQLIAGGGNGYEWTPVSGLSGSQTSSPVASPVSTTVYSAKVTGSNGCKETGSVQVSVLPQPIFAVQPVSVNDCFGDSVMITASGGDTFNWLVTNGVANPYAAQSMVSPSSTTTYAIKIVNNTCRVTGTVYTTVTIKPLPDVVVTKSNDIDCFIGSATLTASGGATYHWYPSTGLSNPDMPNTLVQVAQNTTYYVDVTSADGCMKTDSINVIVNTNTPGNQYLLPNAFTPNNDGTNDCFGIKNWGYITSLDFSIYNRMGQRVFHTTNPLQCWNGVFNGEPQQTGVFVYYIKAITICGALERKGTVILIK